MDMQTHNYDLFVPESVKGHKITIYIPSRAKGCTVDSTMRNKLIEECRDLFCQNCGGATRTEGYGYWLSQRKVEEEPICLMTGRYNGKLDTFMKQVLYFCQRLKNILQQEKVAFEINEKLYFI